MLILVARLLMITIPLIAMNGCPSMEPATNKLLLTNNSDQKIKILLNWSYPDSSLKGSVIDSYLDPHSKGYIGSFHDLERDKGHTVTLFDYAYFKSQWHENVGTPDKYLDEKKILKRFVLSKAELESVGWRLVYP